MTIRTILTLSVLTSSLAVRGQSTAFTYQGQLLNQGIPANGLYDLEFTVYDAVTNGDQVSAMVTNLDTGVTNGLFTAQIDFGAGVFTGPARWLQIGVRTNGSSGAFTLLFPRSQIASTPYAIQAANAAVASTATSVPVGNLTGTLSVGQLPAGVLTNNAAGVNLTGTFSGNGSGLTSLSPASLSTAPTAGYTGVVGWGNDTWGQTQVPSWLSGVKAVSAGAYFSLALLNNGSVIGWGDDSAGETSVPIGANNISAIAAGGYHGLALQNGNVLAWGYNAFGECNVPTGLSNVVAIAAGYFFSLALQANGTVVGWGDNTYGQTTVPAGLSNVVAIGANFLTSVALRSNGTVVAWGFDGDGETNVPAGLTNVVAIACGHYGTVALFNNGTVSDWGAIGTPPTGLSNVIAIASSYADGFALRSNGTVVGWAGDYYGLLDGVAELSNVVALAGGSSSTHALAIERIPVLNFPGPMVGDASGLTNVNAANIVGVFSNITIGTTSSSDPLTVFSSTPFLADLDSTSSIGTWLTLENDAGGLPWWLISTGSNNDEGPGKLLVNGAYQGDIVVVTPTGNVGINKTNPAVALDVHGGIQTDTSITIGGAAAVAPLNVLSSNEFVAFVDGVSPIGTWLVLDSDAGGLPWYVISTATNNGEGAGKLVVDSPLQFDIMAVEPGGNVGIDTASPTSTLEVAGDITADNNLTVWNDTVVNSNLTVSGTTGLGTTSPNFQVSLGGNNANTKLAVWDGGTTSMGFGVGPDQFRIHVPNSANRFSFLNSDAGTEIMTLLGTGSLGIGTTNPSEVLDVYDPSTADEGSVLIESASADGTWLNLQNDAGGARWSLVSTGSASGTGAGKLAFYRTATELMALDSSGNLTIAGSLTQNSDRNVKTNFKEVDAGEVLDKVAALPISTWMYTNDETQRHIGPMAQDFYSAFKVGPDDKHITTIDESGVALAAVKGLNQKVAELTTENEELKKQLVILTEAVKSLQQSIKR